MNVSESRVTAYCLAKLNILTGAISLSMSFIAIQHFFTSNVTYLVFASEFV